MVLLYAHGVVINIILPAENNLGRQEAENPSAGVRCPAAPQAAIMLQPI